MNTLVRIEKAVTTACKKLTPRIDAGRNRTL